MFSSNASQVSDSATYIEDVFSTWLYTGNGSTQTITNGIDLAGEGGLVWLKSRSQVASHGLFDTLRGANNQLLSDSTASAQAVSSRLDAFTSSGFTLGSYGSLNGSGSTYASWTFRKQPKFFDVVTYTGNGANRAISHNLGSVPGMIIVKSTSAADLWECYHRSLGPTQYIRLDSTNAAAAASSAHWQSTTPTSTEFYVGTTGALNTNGVTYVAYLFAHDAGGFGESGEDNVISCGSYTGNGSTNGPTVTLGYEPQWVLIKNATTATTGWVMLDSMRGWVTNGTDNLLRAESSAAELTSNDYGQITATGFELNTANSYVNNSGSTMIYIAIRRGPMKTPTTGTSVFSPIATSSTTLNIGFPTDMTFVKWRTGTFDNYISDRLRGYSSGPRVSVPLLKTNTTAAETTNEWPVLYNVGNTTALVGDLFGGLSNIFYNFGRAPGFMDVVCYTGSFSNRQQAHNLGVVPEMMIVKARTGASAQSWDVYHAALGASAYLRLDLTDAVASSTWPFNGTTPTSSLFYVGIPGGGNYAGTNSAGYTYVAYLFASCPGVSKVGSYTGTGTTQQINCGFTGGARFVLIKRTDSTGAWYVWDSARGIVAGNDSYLLLNSTAAEVTSTDYIDTYSAGFEISSTAPAAINASGGTFLFLAVA